MFVPTLAQELRERIATVFYDGRVVPKHTDTQHFYQDVVDGETYASVTTKTGLFSRAHYKNIAANLAVDHIQSQMVGVSSMSPEQITEMFAYAREAHHHALQQSADWGTHGHELCDRYTQQWIKTGEQPSDIREFVTDEISAHGICAGLSAQLFFKDFTVFPVVSEMKVLSKKYRYAGTLDSIYLVGDVYKGRCGTPDCKHIWFEKGKDKVACSECGRQVVLIPTLVDLKTSNQILDKYEYSCQTALYAQALYEMCRFLPKRIWILQLDKYQPKYTVGVVPDIKMAIKAGLAVNFVSDFATNKKQSIRPLYEKTVIVL